MQLKQLYRTALPVSVRTPISKLRIKLNSYLSRVGASLDLSLKPSVFIVGVQKAGTGSLFAYLIKHPKIFPARYKELSFFDQDIRYHRGLKYYHSQFPLQIGKPSGSVAVDASPDYLYNRKAIYRLHEYCPEAKLIILLRDPVERAYSAWNMYRNRASSGQWLDPTFYDYAGTFNCWMQQDPFPTFEEAIQAELDGDDDLALEPGLLRRGIYHEQIKRVFQYFDRQQVIILESQALSETPAPVMKRLQRFLGLSEFQWESIDYKLHYPGRYNASLSSQTEQRLRVFYQSHNQALHHLLGETFSWMI